jgi:hypothetical protein
MRIRWDGTIDGELVLPSPAKLVAVSADERELFAAPAIGAELTVYSLPSAVTSGGTGHSKPANW